MEKGSGSSITQWSKEEDELICLMWMQSGLWWKSGNAITTNAGVEEMSRLWKKVSDALVANSKVARSQQVLQDHWNYLLRRMESFTSEYNSVVKKYQSSILGNHAASMDQATANFKQKYGNDFEYLNCWEILKDMLVKIGRASCRERVYVLV